MGKTLWIRGASGGRTASLTLRGTLLWVALAFLETGLGGAVMADTLSVPGDFATVQGALDAAQAGDVVEVANGVYFEKISFPRSGTPGAPITLTAAPGASPVLDGTGVSGAHMVSISTRSHLAVIGFEIRNHLGVNDGSGIRIEGSGTNFEIRDNEIHEIRGDDAMGITVYGTESTSISDLRILDNLIYDCDPARSEALTLNGNVEDFLIQGNTVRDVNNIAIDMIGGETDIQPNSNLVARNGVVRRNTVLRANSIYEGGYAGGIYVDGGRDIVIENNRVEGSDLGIEIGAENGGLVTSGIVVRNNVLRRNERAGLVFGGFESAAGRVEDSFFLGNTLVENNTVGENGQGTYFDGGGIGEIWVQWGARNRVEGNLVVAGPENVLVGSFDAGSSVNDVFDHNLYWSGAVGSAIFSRNGTEFSGFTAWRNGTGNDAGGLAANPLLADLAAGDVHLTTNSPAVDAGAPSYIPAPDERDLDLGERLVGARVDIGADELGGASIFTDGFESGSVSAWDAAVP